MPAGSVAKLDMSAVHGEGAVDDAHLVGALERIARPGVEDTIIYKCASATLLYAYRRNRCSSVLAVLLEDTVLDGQFRHTDSVQMCFRLLLGILIRLELFLIIYGRTADGSAASTLYGHWKHNCL